MAEVGRILIVGGGMGGLCLAVALDRQGFDPEVAEIVERSATWPVAGAGIALHANGVRVLRTLGLGEPIERASGRLPRYSFMDRSGELLCSTDLERFWGDVGPCLAITRVRLEEILVAVTRSPHRLGVALTGLRQDRERVEASFSDGSTGEYDLVVGADGIYSTVRRLAIWPVSPGYAGTMAWRSVIPSRPAGVDHLMVLLGDGRFFGLVPVGEGHTYGFAGLDAERFDEPVAGRLERFRAHFAGFGGAVPEYLAALQSDEQLHFGPVEWVDLDRWHDGRVVLIGDAAHAAPPHMGEGGSMAMEDAVVLAESLRTADTVAGALDRYVERRRRRAGWVQEQSRIASKAWVLPPAVRDGVLRERGDQMLQHRYRPLIAPV